MRGEKIYEYDLEEYAWVNTRQVWGVGTVNFATGKIHIDAYMQ